MLKVLSFLTKREGTEMQAFIDYYDNKHVPLSAAWRPLPSFTNADTLCGARN
jgi:hypothetical protein